MVARQKPPRVGVGPQAVGIAGKHVWSIVRRIDGNTDKLDPGFLEFALQPLHGRADAWAGGGAAGEDEASNPHPIRKFRLSDGLARAFLEPEAAQVKRVRLHGPRGPGGRTGRAGADQPHAKGGGGRNHTQH